MPSEYINFINQNKYYDTVHCQYENEQQWFKVDKKVNPLPSKPETTAPYDKTQFLDTLVTASKCTDPDNVRYAIGGICLRGEKRQIISTSGTQALIQENFDFPWNDKDVLAHHRVSNGAGRSHSDREPEQKREYRQEYRQGYRNSNFAPSNDSGSGIASAKQQQFIADLVKRVKGLDWKKVDKYCDQTFGKSCSQLSPKQASELIDSLKQAKAGGGGGLSA